MPNSKGRKICVDRPSLAQVYPHPFSVISLLDNNWAIWQWERVFLKCRNKIRSLKPFDLLNFYANSAFIFFLFSALFFGILTFSAFCDFGFFKFRASVLSISITCIVYLVYRWPYLTRKCFTYCNLKYQMSYNQKRVDQLVIRLAHPEGT